MTSKIQARIAILGLASLLLLSGCVSNATDFCSSQGGQTAYNGGGFAGQHSYCVINGEAKEYVCSTRGQCAFLKESENK